MSKETIDALAALTTKIDESNKGIVESQKHQSLLDEKNIEMDETLKKALESSSKAAEEAQAIKLQIEAIVKTNEYLEKAFSRMGGTKSGENAEMEAKASEEMACYLRTRRPISDAVNEAIVRAHCEKAFFGLGDEKREAEIKTLIAGSNVDGGFFIRPERSATMIKRIFESSAMRSIANIETTSGDVMEFIIDDDEAASGGWVGEVEARTGPTDTPQIGKLTIPAHEQFSEPKATQKMLDDAGFDIEAWLSRKVSDKMIRVENTAFVNGDAAQKPQGFLVLPAWASAGVYERFKLEQVDSGSNGLFVADTIKLLQTSLIEEYQTRAVWTVKRIEWQKIITLKDGEGAYLLDPRSLKTGDSLILLGKPVMFFDDMPVAGTGSLSLAYGDFSVGYTILDRIGFRVIRDNVTQKGFIKFYTTKRTGGAVTNFESIKIQKLSA